MKFAAWRKVLSIFLLAVFLCAVPSLLTACSRTPGSDSTELDYATSRYFQALYRIVNKTFHPAVLEEFHQIADALASCVAAHEDYFTAYPDAKAAYGLMVQIPDILEQNLEPNADGNYVLRELPEEWLFCIFELWHYVYPGVYGAEHSTENCTDAVLLKWIADDAFNGGWSPCHWWLSDRFSISCAVADGGRMAVALIWKKVRQRFCAAGSFLCGDRIRRLPH